MQACFIGHRRIGEKEKFSYLLREIVVELIHKGVKSFLFGSRSEFDHLAWQIVTELQQIYPDIQRIYVRSSYQEIDETYEEYLLKSYEGTYFPQQLKNAGKYCYVERNFEMIDKSTYCVFYYEAEKDGCLPKQPQRKSGTKVAYQYAVKKKKTIINLCELF